ncbi:MAG: ribonuclease III [Actinomycetota bacterium]|jgi:ribonuclease-3|nr:ribonuclease III [Actinomycetota bacterium]
MSSKSSRRPEFDGELAPEAVSLAERMGVSFDDQRLLVKALAHRSWCAEREGQESNERLEFLGDAVLGMVVTERAYLSYPLMAEGALAKLRAEVVSSETLAATARRLDVGPALLLGRGEELSGGREKSSILADAMEALIGAVYLDQGWPAVSELVLGILDGAIRSASLEPGEGDFKTRLQEELARSFGGAPRYEVSGSGPDHDKWFVAHVYLGERLLGTGEGGSKKQAEQAAAGMAWMALASIEAAGAGDTRMGDVSGGDGAGA